LAVLERCLHYKTRVAQKQNNDSYVLVQGFCFWKGYFEILDQYKET